MKKLIKHALFLCTFFLGTQYTALAEPQRIYWGSVHYPPIFIQTGPHKNKGMIDIVTQALQERLPAYRHESLPLNLPRLMTEMKSGTPICFAGLFKTPERQEFISFSGELFRGSPTLLITSSQMKEKIKKFQDEKGDVDLQALLSSETITLDIMEGRAFGPNVDQVIKTKEGNYKSAIRVRKGKTNAEKVVKLMALGRINATLTHGLETYYQAMEQDMSHLIDMYRIQGNDNRLPIYVGCSKGDWSTAFMPHLNRAIGEIVQKGVAINARNRWLPKNLWK